MAATLLLMYRDRANGEIITPRHVLMSNFDKVDATHRSRGTTWVDVFTGWALPGARKKKAPREAGLQINLILEEFIRICISD
jgi:hypothetical protein